MALSKSEVPVTVRNIPVIAQHYLMCGTEDCETNCLFYCNPCHRPMCEQCKNEHQIRLDTKSHEVVPYRLRKRQLPVEKCTEHPSKDIDMICEDCQVPLCYKCGILDHRGHKFDDLEAIYSENFTLCLEEIYNIYQYFLPTSQKILGDIKQDAEEINAYMNKIRAYMKAEAWFLKSLVDEAMSENIEQVNKIEESLMAELLSQNQIYEEYNGYLKNLAKEYNGYLSHDKVKNNPILFSLSERLKIKSIPETRKIVYPVFNTSKMSKENVTKLLGNITFPCTKPENREIIPMETVSTRLKQTGIQIQNYREKIQEEHRLSLTSSATKVREFAVPVVESVYHISLGRSDRGWFSDRNGDLVQTDTRIRGKLLEVIKTSVHNDGHHTFTQDGDLIFTDKVKKVINITTFDKKISEFIRTGSWEPLSIHSSQINGDILVGMVRDEKGKITRYNKTGKEIQNIQWESRGQELFSTNPHYITENINGDICVSVVDKESVVVVSKSGQYRFSYKGQGSPFDPWGICTDVLGHILVCANYSGEVHLLDQEGQFLSLLLTEEKGIYTPLSVCVDDENNLHVGQWKTNKVTVFKYLQ